MCRATPETVELICYCPRCRRSFPHPPPTRNGSGIARDTFNPGFVRKVVTVAAEVRSFARAAKVLAAVADIRISSRHVGRLARTTGSRLAEENRQRAKQHRVKKLPVEVTSIPDVAVVEIDGDRIRTREEGLGPGTHEPGRKELKNGRCCRMSSDAHASDPDIDDKPLQGDATADDATADDAASSHYAAPRG